MNELLTEKLNRLPTSPGVYLMKDARGAIIYVGKAVVLKNRVRQYFQSGKNHSAKVKAMVNKIVDFDTIITSTEVEALILECNLIKQHRPRYNISLKDDKSYPYVKVTMADEYPRVLLTRRLLKDGAKYFGPYASVGSVNESLKLLRRLFPLRTCKRLENQRPCLEYHIKRCLAPCAGLVDKNEYADMVREVCLFLEGRTEIVEKGLTERMNVAAGELKFELAARLRDQLKAVRKATEKQNAVTAAGDMDAIGTARSPAGICVQIFLIREGKMIGREHFFLNGAEDESDEAVLIAFLEQYYHRATFIPREILLPFNVESAKLLQGWLTEKKQAKVIFEIPQRGTKHDIVKLAVENAEKYLSDEAERLTKETKQTMGAVEELAAYLSLKELPRRMECFDISHMQGSETVASMVVFENGAPKKSDYRRFKIQSAEGKPDDFLSMREVTTRRYCKETSWTLPDLIVIDGGKGQLSSALSVIRDKAGLTVPVVALAESFEYIFTEYSNEPVILPRNSQALYLMQRIRDEAHRFAITYHRKLRGKRNLVSVLDNISGIGPKRRKAVFDFFGSLEKIKAATPEELLAVKGMTKTSAQAIYNFFRFKESYQK